MDTNAIRARLAAQGWKLLEIPVKSSNPDPAKRGILHYRITASNARNGKSIQITGKTLDEAIRLTGISLGVIPRETPAMITRN